MKTEQLLHRKGQTWQVMLQALGSRKPWVSRSIREWGVSVKPGQDGHADFGWHHLMGRFKRKGGFGRASFAPRTSLPSKGGGASRISFEKLELAWAFLLFGGLRDYMTVYVALTTRGLEACTEDHPDLAMFISPKWIIFVNKEASFNIPVPTKLVIEAIRLIRMDRGKSPCLVSRGHYHDKHTRNVWTRHYKHYGRKQWVRDRGDHKRWIETAKVVAAILASNDVKPIDGTEMQVPMPRGLSPALRGK